MNQPTFTDAAFRRSHSKAPRGNGCWAFQATTRRTAFESEMTGPVEFFSGTFTEAKAQAVAAGMGEATGMVAVCP